MKAIFKTPNAKKDAINYSRDKETVNTISVYGTNEHGQVLTLVDARFYMGRSASASAVYCALWVCGYNFHISGRGMAGGVLT